MYSKYRIKRAIKQSKLFNNVNETIYVK